MAQQRLDRRPGQPGSLDVDQAATLLDVVNLRRRNARVVAYVVNILRPEQGKDKAQRTHEPKARPPARQVDNPSQDRGEDHQREILRRVESRGGAAALVGGKPRGNDAAVSRKDRGLSKTRDQPQKKDLRKQSGDASEQGAEREHHNADAVDLLRSKTVQQRAGWQ